MKDKNLPNDINNKSLEELKELANNIVKKLENEKDLCSERENELRHVQNQHLELSRDYENQIRGIHDLLVERDQQVQRLGEILQQEMAATDVETGSTPRIEALVDRVRGVRARSARIPFISVIILKLQEYHSYRSFTSYGNHLNANARIFTLECYEN